MIEDRRKYIADNFGDDIIVFDDPEFDCAIIGVSSDNRAIYDYDKMVEGLTEEFIETGNGPDARTMAIEWIEYNTLRSLPYVEKSPIVMYSIENEFED